MMVMPDGEILELYRDSKIKRRQVAILADLNCVSNKTMAQWLVDHGQEVDKRYLSAGIRPAAPAAPKRKVEKKEKERKMENAAAVEKEVTYDQMIKADEGKPELTLVPVQIIFDIAQIRMYGNSKYPAGGVENWRKVEPERYRNAAFRHFLEYIRDPRAVDEESGLPHRWHLECNLAFLAELEREEHEE